MPTIVKVKRFDGFLHPVDLDGLPHRVLGLKMIHTADPWVSPYPEIHLLYKHPDFLFVVFESHIYTRKARPEDTFVLPWAGRTEIRRKAYEFRGDPTVEEASDTPPPSTAPASDSGGDTLPTAFQAVDFQNVSASITPTGPMPTAADTKPIDWIFCSQADVGRFLNRGEHKAGLLKTLKADGIIDYKRRSTKTWWVVFLVASEHDRFKTYMAKTYPPKVKRPKRS